MRAKWLLFRVPGLLLAASIYTAGYADSSDSNTSDRHVVEQLEVTILSTMLSEDGIGEWGFAALIVVDGRRILFDTGAGPETVLKNARALGVELGDVEDVILSHNHWDHTGGLISLRREIGAAHPAALQRAHVGRGIFWERLGQPAAMAEKREHYVALGGEIIEHDGPVQIYPGVWLTGPVPRVHPEKNYGNPLREGHPVGQVHSPDGLVDDNVPESMSLVVNTGKGLVVISGCGHAGMINTLEYARRIVRPVGIHAAVGGFHLLHASNDHLAWTAEKLVDLGLANFVGAHCTGLEPVYRFRDITPLERSTSVVGSVGAKFSLATGIEPRALAH